MHFDIFPDVPDKLGFLVSVVLGAGNEDFIVADGVLVLVVLLQVDVRVLGVVYPELGVQDLQVVHIHCTLQRTVGFVVLYHSLVQVLHQQHRSYVAETAEHIEHFLGALEYVVQVGHQNYLGGFHLAYERVHFLRKLQALSVHKLGALGEQYLLLGRAVKGLALVSEPFFDSEERVGHELLWIGALEGIDLVGDV